LTIDHGVLGDFLSDPQVMAQVAPLLNTAIDERIAPLTAQIERLTEGVQLIAQATVEAGRAPVPTAPQPTAPQYPPAAAQPPWPGADPNAIPVPAQNGAQAQQPYQPPAPAPTAAVDKLAQFAPILMQYLTRQTQGGANLGTIAETLGAAAQIGQFVNAPMWQGMKMATDMMSMSGRAGIDPVTAASTLGDMIDAQTNSGAPGGSDAAGSSP
jgi:hypothetical protein